MERQVGRTAVGHRLRVIQQPRRFPDHAARELEPDGAVGELPADRLVPDDEAPALAADVRIVHGRFVRGAAEAEVDRRDSRRGLRRGCNLRERARAFLAEHVVRRHLAVLERHAGAGAVMPADRLADGLQRLAHRQPGRVARHQQRGAALAGARLHREQLGHRRVRDEGKRAVDDPFIALLHRDRFDAALGGHRTVVIPAHALACTATGEGEVIAIVLDELRQEALLLFRRHQSVEQQVAERRSQAEHRGEVGVARAQFFHDDAGSEPVGAGAARLFRQGERAQPHLRGLVEQVGQQRLLERLQPVRVQRDRLDLVLDEIAHRVAEFQLLGGEMQVVHVGGPGSSYKIQG